MASPLGGKVQEGYVSKVLMFLICMLAFTFECEAAWDTSFMSGTNQATCSNTKRSFNLFCIRNKVV